MLLPDGLGALGNGRLQPRQRCHAACEPRGGEKITSVQTTGSFRNTSFAHFPLELDNHSPQLGLDLPVFNRHMLTWVLL